MTVDVHPAVIEEARRRQRNRRLATVGVLLVAAGAAAYFIHGGGSGSAGPGGAARNGTAQPPTPARPLAPLQAATGTGTVTTMVVWSSSAGSDNRLFHGTLVILQRPRTAADAVPASLLQGHHGLPSLVSRRALHGQRLLVSRSRAISADGQTIYIIPTSGRSACALTADSFGCLPVPDRHGLSWIGHNESNTKMMFIGWAWNAIATMELVWDHGRVPVKWAGDLFWVTWRVPVSLAVFRQPHPRFVLTYRDGRAPATVPVG